MSANRTLDPGARSQRVDADVVVVGAGPAGIAAATRAAESGRRVLLCDENRAPGGQVWRARVGESARGVARRWRARLGRSGATVLCGTAVVDGTAAGYGGGFILTAEGPSGAIVVQAHVVILATGARERFIPFPGWTLPGVIGVGAAQALQKGGVSFAGKRVVISGSGPLLLPVAAALTAHGARVLLVAEQAAPRKVMRFAAGLWRDPARLFQAARYRIGFLTTPYRLGTWVTAARGDRRVEEVDVTDGVTARTISCDVLCAAFGLVPNTELARLLGCTMSRGSVVVNERQETNQSGVFCAGEPTGIGGVDLAILEGEIAGLCSAGRQEEARELTVRLARARVGAAAMDEAFAPRAELRDLPHADTIVCRCEDISFGAIDSRWTMRKARLYTRAGMGACQGRVCGAALEFLHGWPSDSTRIPCQPAHCSTLIADGAHDAPSADHGA